MKKAHLQSLGVLALLLVSCSVIQPPRYSQGPQISTLTQIILQEVGYSHGLNIHLVSEKITELSQLYGLDPLLIASVIKVESQFNPKATSHFGARGLMQVTPIVVRELKNEFRGLQNRDLYDVSKNLLVGTHYLDFLLEKYHGNLEHALIAYNMGPTAVDRRLQQGRSLPTTYYRKVMSNLLAFRKIGVSLYSASKSS